MSLRGRTIALTFAVGAFLAADLLGGAPLHRAVERARAAYQPEIAEGELRRRNQSAFGKIFGEVRATMSDLLFVKSSRYLHAGVGYSPEIRVDALNVQQQLLGSGANTKTDIPSAAEDFRGFLGNLEREVKPYRQAAKAHIHTDTTELLPWFRIMTLSNPRFVRGYRVGGMTLMQEGKWREAMDFMNEGLANNKDNPEVFRLYQTIASLHRSGQHDRRYPWDGEWLVRSLAAAERGFELAMRQRPPKGQEGVTSPDGFLWTDDVEEDFDLAAHLRAQLYREMAHRNVDRSRLEQSLRCAEELAQLAPQYDPIRDFILRLRKELAEW